MGPRRQATSARPFGGLKVADFSWAVVGPVITRYLAIYGATVVRIESSTRPDVIRTTPPFRDGGLTDLDCGAYFASVNASKLGIGLDLRHPKSHDVAKRIIAWADVVCESFRPGVTRKLGLDYDAVKAIKPDIIMVSASAQGQTGPHSGLPAYGAELVSLVGLTNLTGWPDRGPSQPFGAYTDMVGPRFGAAVVIAALEHRRRTGQGQHIDLSQYEAALRFLAPALLDYVANGVEATRQGNRSSQDAPHGVYRCRGEDRWCAIHVETGEQWPKLCQVIGEPQLTADPRFSTLDARKENEPLLDGIIEEWTKGRSADTVMGAMQEAGVPAGVVQTSRDIFRDPQLRHRRHYHRVKHPRIGWHRVESSAFQLSDVSARIGAGPCLRQHNEYFYKRVLGMTPEEYDALLCDGVFS